MIFNTYRKKLIGLFIIIAMVPILLFAINMYTRINTYIIDENIKARTSFIENESEKLEIWFMANAEKVKDISGNYPFIKELMAEENGKERVNEYLSSQLTSSKEILNLRVVMEDSNEYSSKKIQFSGNPRLRHDYINTLLLKKLVWTLQEEDANGNFAITASIPFFDKSGKMEGVLLVDFSFEGILKRIGEMDTDGDNISYVVTRLGKILNISDEGIIDIEKDHNNYEKTISSLAWETTAISMGNKDITLDKEYLAFFSTVPSVDWKIIHLYPKGAFYNSLSVMVRNTATISVITLASIIIFAMLFSKLFSEPLEKLKEGAMEIQNGNYDYKIEIKKENEFGQVALVFNDMALKLKKSYKDLNDNNTMLVEVNEQLQDMNTELEASYEQLKATTDQLNESEEKFKTLVENMYDLVWVLDGDLNISFANDQVKALLQIDNNKFIGKNLKDFLHLFLGDKERVVNAIKETDLENKEVKIVNENGDKIIVEANTKRIFENNKLVGIYGVSRDITERKNMEESILKRNKELLVINRISRSLTTTMNIETLMQRAVDSITKLMNVSICTIRSLENDKLKLKACSGEISDLVSAENIPVDEDDVGIVVNTGEIHIIDVSKQSRKSKYTKKVVESNQVNYLNAFPIKARGKTSGTLVVGSKEKLDKGEFNILTSISSQIALITENIDLYQGLKDNYLKTIETLAAAIEAKDEYTEGHSYRVAKYSIEIAKYMNMPKKFCEEIEVAGILHDIGKLGIKDGVLTKPGKLTEKEYEAIRRHPMIGSKILEGVGFSEVIMNAIKFHHKRYDLKGYPEEIYIEELPLEASIIGVADAFDAITTSRAYRKAMTLEFALEELARSKNVQFNPYIVDIMIDIYKKDKNIIRNIMLSETLQGSGIG